MFTIYIINFIKYMKEEGVERFTLNELGGHLRVFNSREIERIIRKLGISEIIEEYSDSFVFKSRTNKIYELGTL